MNSKIWPIWVLAFFPFSVVRKLCFIRLTICVFATRLFSSMRRVGWNKLECFFLESFFMLTCYLKVSLRALSLSRHSSVPGSDIFRQISWSVGTLQNFVDFMYKQPSLFCLSVNVKRNQIKTWNLLDDVIRPNGDALVDVTASIGGGQFLRELRLGRAPVFTGLSRSPIDT
jgi:hypothetical protein